MKSKTNKIVAKFQSLPRRTRNLCVFLLATLLISFFMSNFIHVLFTKTDYNLSEIASTTVRSPKDIKVQLESARINGESSLIEVKKNEVVVRAGDRITKDQLQKLKAIRDVSQSIRPFRSWAGYFILTSTIILTVYAFFMQFYPSFRPKTTDAVFICSIMFLSFLGIQIFSILGHSLSETFGKFSYDTILLACPAAAAGMVIQVILGATAVNLFVLVFGLMTGAYLESSWLFLAIVVLGNLVGACSLKRCTKRSVFLRAGFRVAAINIVIVLAFLLLYGNFEASEKIYRVLAAALGGFLSGIIAAATIPVAEYLGKYTTDMKLLELSSLDQPLLRDLSIQAPGTWNHSMVVGQMGEAAAEAIYANPLLVRVAAYYHDIGKGNFPAYFIENQVKENRHDKLTPSMSALIIKTHIKDGVEMGEKANLPPILIDMIKQHHGTSLIEFFYEKAKRDAEEGEIVEEANFRYNGPKPQTKEAAILMLADGIEASSRTLQDPSPAKLQGLVQRIINKIFVNGELDESGLTLRDLHVIAKVFVRVLTGIYHRRIEYPDSGKDNKKIDNGADNAETNKSTKRPQETKTSDSGLEKGSGKGTQADPTKSKDKDDPKTNIKRLGLS